MESYINTFILSACVVQGILLAVMLLIKKQSKTLPNILLSAFVLIITLHVLVTQLSKSWLIETVGPIYAVFYFFPYLYGPLVYLYICKKISEPGFKIKDLLHFIPFVFSISLSAVVVYKLINIFDYINMHAYNITDTFVQLAFLTTYIILSKRKLKEAENNEKKITLDFKKWFFEFSNLVWLTGFLLIVGLTFFYYNIYASKMQLLFLLIPLIIYRLSYKLITQPELFITPNGISLAANDFVKYKKTGLNENETREILNKLTSYIEQQKPYLDSELTIEKLAAAIDIPKHHISQVINQHLSKNFYDFINENRISLAKELLVTPTKAHFTIAAIAYESGFNSISSFNEVFKKHTGLTPSAYRKSAAE